MRLPGGAQLMAHLNFTTFALLPEWEDRPVTAPSPTVNNVRRQGRQAYFGWGFLRIHYESTAVIGARLGNVA